MSHPALSPDALQLLLRELRGMAAQYQRDPSYDGTLTLNAAAAFALVKLFSEFGTPKRSGGRRMTWLREHYILPRAKQMRADNPKTTYAEVADAICDDLSEANYDHDIPEGLSLAEVEKDAHRLVDKPDALLRFLKRHLRSA